MAGLDVIRTLTLRAKAEGFKQAEGDVRSLGDAYETSARRQLSVERTLGQLERRFVDGARQAQEFARVQRQLNTITAQNPALQERANKVLDEARSKLFAANDNTQKYANTSKLTRYELINLSRQIQDVGVSLASGQAVMNVAIQQGSQIADVFASSRATLAGFARQIAAMITPMRLFALGALAVGAAGIVLYNSWKTVEMQFLNLSERIDVPIARLHELQQVAAGRGMGLDEFVKGMESFGDQVDRAKMGLGELAQLFRVNGQQVGDVTESLVKLADMVQNAASGAQRYRIIQEAGLPATAEWVRLLSQGGPALRRALDEAAKFPDANDEMIRKAREFDEAWSKGWSNFVNNSKSAIVSVLSGLSGLIDRASEALTRNMLRFRSERQLGLQALGAGVGARFNMQEANQFYDLMRGAAGEGARQRAKTRQDTTELLGLEQRRIQSLGDIATVQEKVRAKQIEINQARIQGVSISGDEERRLLRITELQEKSRLSMEKVSVLGEAATTTEEYQAAIDRLQLSLAQTNISQETFNRAVIAANPIIKEVSSSIQSNLVTGLADIFDGTKTVSQGFADMSKAIIRAIEEMIIKLTIVKPLMTGLQSGLGGVLPTFGVSTAAVAHAGGIVGGTWFPSRIVEPPMFAPRLHNGLRSDEMFAILQRGERVVPKGAGAGVVVQVTNQVINNASNIVSTRTTSEDDGRGGRKNTIIIDEMVSSAIGRTGSRSAMAAQSAGRLARR